MGVVDGGERGMGARVTSLGASGRRLFALVVDTAVSLSADVCRARNGSIAWPSRIS